MALEAVVYPQDLFTTTSAYSLVGSSTWNYDFGLMHDEGDDHKALLGILDNNIIDQQSLCTKWDSSLVHHAKDHHHFELHSSSSPESCNTMDQQSPTGSVMPSMKAATVTPPTSGRRKRRRTKSSKNEEELEIQRMTHIAVERNRRKQMNEYLAVLRSLMPSSYVQRGDQASIVGGAVNFVKELEQLLQSMEVQKRIKVQQSQESGGISSSSPFAEFFTFPQYSTSMTQNNISSPVADEAKNNKFDAVADIEVTMVDSHANLKILSNRRPRQLLKMVVGFQNLGLSILHLNVTSIDQMVLYSLSVKVEEGSQLNTVDEIAAAVNQLLSRILQDEAAFSYNG